jgi:hypothetical protein
MGARGRVFADRFHERILRSPTEVANVVKYVLGNAHKHHGWRAAVDPFSSANMMLDDPIEGGPPWARPECWLLRVGWKRFGARIQRGRFEAATSGVGSGDGVACIRGRSNVRVPRMRMA